MKRRRFLQAAAALATSSLVQACDLAPHDAATHDTGSGRFLPTGLVGRIGWDAFLQQWSDEAVDIVRAAGLDFSETLIAFARTGSLRYEGATSTRIEAREEALGVRFPESFRELLRVSDGWRSPYRGSGHTILPVARVDWLRAADGDLIRDWRRYRSWLPERDPRYSEYGPGQDPVYFRSRHLADCLAVSPTVDDAAVYLLNTAVMTGPGELEAWELDHRLPGAHRYRTFAGLMEVIYQEEIDALRYWAGAGPA